MNDLLGLSPPLGGLVSAKRTSATDRKDDGLRRRSFLGLQSIDEAKPGLLPGFTVSGSIKTKLSIVPKPASQLPVPIRFAFQTQDSFRHRPSDLVAVSLS